MDQGVGLDIKKKSGESLRNGRALLLRGIERNGEENS
jgi:hypothetical protein